MRILTVGSMYPPHSLGGYELTWRSSVALLRAEGHSVRVLATDYRALSPDAGIDEGPDVHRELRWYWRDHGFPDLRARDRLALERHNRSTLQRHLTEFAPDVVAWWPVGGFSLSLIEQVGRAGIPAVAVIGDDWLLYAREVDGWTRLFDRRPRALGSLAARVTGIPTRGDVGAVSAWLFNSETVRGRALEAWPELRGTVVAHPGVDPELFQPAPPGAWGWRLMYAGRIDSRKGIDTAVRALGALPREATLEVVGAGDERYLEELQALAAELELGDRVRFGRAPRPELPARYAAADAVVFPVRWEEPWGLVPLEAMAVGRPIVATGTGGSGEYLRHEENCLTFEPRDSPESLADAVRRLAEDEQLRAGLVEGGRATAARFTEAAYDRAVANVLVEVAT